MSVRVSEAYQALTTETVIRVVEPLDLFPDSSRLTVKEVGDGNLNLVFRIIDPETGRSVVVKQALPYAKVVGESWPLTLDRNRIESEALRLAARYVPELVPAVHHTDETLALTVMEDLSSHVILRKGWIEGSQFPELAGHIGTYVAKTLFYTSDFYLHPFEKKELVKRFINPELCKITEDLVFTDPFFDHETNDFPDGLRPAVERLWNDTDLRREAGKLKYDFLTRAEALVHGDLHSGSIFATRDSTKVIDQEFAFFGPFGFDLGQFFANVVLNWISQEWHARDPEKRSAIREELLSVISGTWDTFVRVLDELWTREAREVYASVPGVKEAFLARVFEDAVGFAGCEVIRRTIGLAHVADLDSIEDSELQIRLKEKALRLGSVLIKERSSVRTTDDLLAAIREVGA
ncbi:S-methyl-5-thioribose kinase [Staphylospora marina]|uniref:S-methyl-5-thioribose kinase n=1 Tax=Staphylospora marina TaxID=2490858 RepID=UPI000F5BE317|nr:S-methyl-5-thioribose kinase [Staphylospora marina]